MLVNDKNEVTGNHVKFISYTGRWPNLCSGVLTLRIDGEEVKFGHESADYDWKTHEYRDNNHDKFWVSGGSCGFESGYRNEYVKNGKWKNFAHDIPEQFREYAHEIDEVFNANVPYGCCGGCL